MDEYTENKIKEILKTKTLRATGEKASGCINEGEAYETDHGRVFIKKNNSKYAKIMFESELASLEAIEKTATIRVPHPIAVVEGSKNTFYSILEYVNIKGLRSFTHPMGEDLAKLHLHNENVAKGAENYVHRFGFHQSTCVGLLPVKNEWTDDWPTFYTKRIDEQITRIEKTGDKEASALWSQLRPLVPKFFEGITVKPSLLHGDLWTGNVGETDTEPIIFDPGSVYGHHEFDLAMTTLFGRLGRNFYSSYHQLIPKAKGFQEREKLYHLFHYLNHWNHFGGGYKGSSLSTMKSLLKISFPLNCNKRNAYI